MPRDGAVILSDLYLRDIDRLNVACRHCDRRGSYLIPAAIVRWGDAKLTDLLQILAEDCLRMKGKAVRKDCGAYYPDL